MTDITPPPLDTVCAQEPIRTPGSIQPHGMMVITDLAHLRVAHVAGDIEGRLGVTSWEGHHLRDVLGPLLAARVEAVTRPGAADGFMGQLHTPAGEMLDVSAFASPPWMIVELESAVADDIPTALVLDALAEGAADFERAATVADLCGRAAESFHQLTHFDHVMIYRFLDDNAGQVVAEHRRAGARSFLNHHFPAADIPSQARDLYVRNRVRVIPDRAYAPLPLRPAWASPAPLDMSDSALRSVSPVHLEYLRNMDVRASASVSIVKDGVLWGLVACHHDVPRMLNYTTRAACRSLAGSLARQLKAKEEALGFHQRIRMRSFEDDIGRLLLRDGSVEQAIAGRLVDIGLMLDADGVALVKANRIVTSGACPGERELRELAGWIGRSPWQPVLVSDELSNDHPPAVNYQMCASGMLSIALSETVPWLLICFRADHAQTLIWAGNPHLAHQADRQGQLTPRASFAAWQQTVRGRARRWTRLEIDAATRLREAVLAAEQNRQVVELNHQLITTVRDKDLLLQEKAFLMEEINHRVQNSLQLVSSFLALQARGSRSPETTAELVEADRRLQAVAMVHRCLYASNEIVSVDLASYIEELCKDSVSVMGRNWAQHMSLDLEPARVSIRHAVTIGLVLTELIMNCNKYAYGGAPGPIAINLAVDRESLQLSVSDRGTGLVGSAGVIGTNAPTAGRGTKIIYGLVTQIAGVLAYKDNHPGIKTLIYIPIKNPDAS